MTKQELKKYIDSYKEAEGMVTRLDDEFGINIWNSRNNNFYNIYNKLLHNLLKEILGEDGVNLLEDYIFDQITISFDELCNDLNISE